MSEQGTISGEECIAIINDTKKEHGVPDNYTFWGWEPSEDKAGLFLFMSDKEGEPMIDVKAWGQE